MKSATGRAPSLAVWPLLGLVAAIGLVFDSRSYDPNAPKLQLAFAAVGLALAALGIEARSARLELPRRRELDSWVLAALGAACASALASEFPWLAGPAIRDLSLVALAYGCARMALAPEDGPRLEGVLGLVTTAASVFGLAQLIAPTGMAFVAPFGHQARTLAATMANPDYFAAWLLMTWPFLASGLRRSEKLRWVWSAVIALALTCLILSFSRAAWVGLAAQLVLARAGAGWSRRSAAAAAGLALVVVLAMPGLTSKLGSAATARQRLVIWRAALGMATQRPLLGHGPGAFGAVFPAFRAPDFRATGMAYVDEFAHDLPLHAVACGGLLGLAMLALGLAALTRDGESIEARHLAAVGMLAQNLFSVTLCVTPLAAALAFLVGGPEQRPSPGGPVAPRALAGALWGFAALAAWGCLSAGYELGAGRALRDGRLATEAGLARGTEGWQPRAAQLLEEARALGPLAVAPRYRLAGVRALAGDLGTAAAAYIMVEALWPGYAELPRNRAEVYRAMGALVPARRQARLWSDMNAVEPAGPVLLAEIEEEAGDRVEARKNALLARDRGASGPAFEALLGRLLGP
ncbi:MAG: O-antigen ligase family protein [Candidatus Wallbacteria bacterium]|nr:O-antigen ligase family protein [Candidatus Wallbacteria bacterium]